VHGRIITRLAPEDLLRNQRLVVNQALHIQTRHARQPGKVKVYQAQHCTVGNGRGVTPVALNGRWIGNIQAITIHLHRFVALGVIEAKICFTEYAVQRPFGRETQRLHGVGDMRQIDVTGKSFVITHPSHGVTQTQARRSE